MVAFAPAAASAYVASAASGVALAYGAAYVLVFPFHPLSLLVLVLSAFLYTDGQLAAAAVVASASLLASSFPFVHFWLN